MKSQRTKKIMCIIGTRPEAIKMFPIFLQLKKNPSFTPVLVVTSQHKDLVLQVLALFDIQPNYDLDVMTHNQTLLTLSSKILLKLEEILEKDSYDLVIAQGDTTTTFCSALASFYNKIPFAHVEAGLRSNNFNSPFPEEMNRVTISKLSNLHFCPTENAKNNLFKECVKKESVYVTGNTVVDAVRLISEQAILPPFLKFMENSRVVIITLHRRENFGDNHIKALNSIKKFSQRVKDKNIKFLVTVHPNPNIKNLIYEILGELDNVHLIDANKLNYHFFIAALKNSYFIITDSGGIQEEASVLKKPVFVLREETERTEGVDAGIAKLISPLSETIEDSFYELVENPHIYNAMIEPPCPYGNGYSSKKIARILGSYLV